MLDDFLVFAAVAWATAYASWRLLPGGWRETLGDAAASLAQRLGGAAADPAVARRRASARTACGGCNACAGKPKPAAVAIIHIKKR